MSFDFGYLVSVNPTAAYVDQYNAILLDQMQSKIDRLEEEASLDDFEKGYRALIEGDTKKAIRLWEKEAQLGVVEAQIALGDLYHHRLKNLQKAISHYEKAYQSGETKAGALIYAAKLNLGKLQKQDLEEATNDVKDEPWFKYVEAVLELRLTSYLELSIDSNNDLEELFEKLEDAIDGGVLPAGTLLAKLYATEFFFLMYLNGQSGDSDTTQEYFVDLARVCAENGEVDAAEIYLLWLLFRGELLEAKSFIATFESQFEWPSEKNYECFGLVKSILLLPIQEKSVAKKIFGTTKSLTSALGSGMLDTITSDWESFESYKNQLSFLEPNSEWAKTVVENANHFGVIEARRILALRFIELGFIDESKECFFGPGDDNVFLHMYFAIVLSQICIEIWQLAIDKNKADPEYIQFLPVLRDFNDAFLGKGEEFESKWYERQVDWASKAAPVFNEKWMPFLSYQYGKLKSARNRST